jgi:hypothetical protein
VIQLTQTISTHRHSAYGASAMKRIRLSTVLLLIVVVALCTALVVRERQVAREEAELKARLALSRPLFVKRQAAFEQELRVLDESSLLDRRTRLKALEQVRQVDEHAVQKTKQLRRVEDLLRFDKLPDP